MPSPIPDGLIWRVTLDCPGSFRVLTAIDDDGNEYIAYQEAVPPDMCPNGDGVSDICPDLPACRRASCAHLATSQEP